MLSNLSCWGTADPEVVPKLDHFRIVATTRPEPRNSLNRGTLTWVLAYAACKRSRRPAIPSATLKRHSVSVNPDRPKTEMPRWISIAIPVSAGFFILALSIAA